MRAYLYKRNEILIFDSFEEGLADAYNRLFDKFLLSRSISEKRIFQSINIVNNKISSEPHLVKALLQKKELPAFKFLFCKN